MWLLILIYYQIFLLHVIHKNIQSKLERETTVKPGQVYPTQRLHSNELNVWKMNPIVVAATSIKIKSKFGQIEKSLNG